VTGRGAAVEAIFFVYLAVALIVPALAGIVVAGILIVRRVRRTFAESDAHTPGMVIER
jgi:hypothetical protein